MHILKDRIQRKAFSSKLQKNKSRIKFNIFKPFRYMKTVK